MFQNVAKWVDTSLAEKFSMDSMPHTLSVFIFGVPDPSWSIAALAEAALPYPHFQLHWEAPSLRPMNALTRWQIPSMPSLFQMRYENTKKPERQRYRDGCFLLLRWLWDVRTMESPGINVARATFLLAPECGCACTGQLEALYRTSTTSLQKAHGRSVRRVALPFTLKAPRSSHVLSDSAESNI
jgi:hypothetical protein